jgi:ABC-type dipeptide/oligopeptide/nickel transport system permease subunit
VRTARAKGLSSGTVLFRHVLRNAMIPILTGVVVVIPLLFMGSLLTESFFGIPGLGSYTIDAINAQDFAVVRAMVFIGSVLYIVGLILTDISYTLVDPRIRFDDWFLPVPCAWFGTDKVGQDVLYQVLKSVRTALVIGTCVTTLVTMPLAVGCSASLLLPAISSAAGWMTLIQYVLHTCSGSIPGVLLIAAPPVLMMQVVIDTHPQWFDTAAERADLRLLALCFILGLTSWTGLARLLRGETLKLRELEYMQAAQAFGVADLRIITRHLLPNLMHIVIIALVMDFSGLVLAEAVLSYVGIGVDPSMISFGTMINNARMELGARADGLVVAGGSFSSFMFVLVLAANLLADAVRDAFDPRMA